jgi:hypothetical protein
MKKQRYDIEKDGCLSCTFEGCKIEAENGGYLQAGYTPQDEYGECPDEANSEVIDLLKDNTEG